MKQVFWRIAIAAMELAAPALCLTPLFILWCWKRKFRPGKALWHYLFLLYLCAMLGVTGFPNIRYFEVDLNVNLIPFVDMLSGLTGTLLNVALFLPLGFLLPFLSRKYDSLKATMTTALFTTVSIELLQIFTHRATDIDDLITNCLGAFLGFLLAKPLKKPANREETSNTIRVLYAAVALFMFFAEPYVLPVIWDALYS